MNAQANFRNIIHVDMDAFFAAVEQRDNPSLKGKPVIVGGRPDSRGVVATASYEARRFGIHSAMPINEAWRRCPEGVFLPVNMAKYQKVSKQIHAIFLDYTPLVEPLSLDEAFLDVTGSTKLFGSAEKIACALKQRIRRQLDLTASVGVAGNKFLAKLASDLEKPDGFVVIDPNRIQQLLDPLSVTKIWGVGRKTAEQLSKINIHTIKDLRSLDEKTLTDLFGTLGRRLYELARGIDNRPVESMSQPKSIGREITFDEDIANRETLETVLLKLALDVARRLRKKQLKARTITLKIRYPDFRTFSRSRTLAEAIDLDDLIYRQSLTLLSEIPLKSPVRLLGITLSNFISQEVVQPSLFEKSQNREKEVLTRVIDEVNEKFGKDIVTRARLLKNRF
ncbi:MAG: DNA polymerase IV [Peptococcaceae bacterium]|nr:DNA polymerase IV [Peptococcaceae bacterium]